MKCPYCKQNEVSTRLYRANENMKVSRSPNGKPIMYCANCSATFWRGKRRFYLYDVSKRFSQLYKQPSGSKRDKPARPSRQPSLEYLRRKYK